ncbi:hypothetical protein HDF16_006370 [Granulicella aggregans]|uniref:Uncharacterized protein n=1 Tax=Granulicella aggregans TaxID=474949 RepID=A0A7W7ZLA5_9BACT|nr:hypothetical protein [Granulicella aggregans]MBB5061634.1 hypothetical protein [Granulicella aggregans]
MAIEVKDVTVRSPYGRRFASAHFIFECEGEITTDEKTYRGQMRGAKECGFDWYYEQLYGELPDTWPPQAIKPEAELPGTWENSSLQQSRCYRQSRRSEPGRVQSSSQCEEPLLPEARFWNMERREANETAASI